MSITLTDSATGETFTARLAQATPQEIDTELFELYLQFNAALSSRESAVEHIHFALGDERVWHGKRSSWKLEREDALALAAQSDRHGVITARTSYADAQRRLESADNSARALEAEYTRRPWTRAFLVTDGHVHRSTACSTCYPTTEFHWLVELAGDTEDEIVAAAGERACTVCYPSAPVETLNRPSALLTPTEAERAAERAAREEAKAAREAKKIANAPTKDGQPLTVTPDIRSRRTETFATERAAQIWATDHVFYHLWPTATDSMTTSTVWSRSSTPWPRRTGSPPRCTPLAWQRRSRPRPSATERRSTPTPSSRCSRGCLPASPNPHSAPATSTTAGALLCPQDVDPGNWTEPVELCLEQDQPQPGHTHQPAQLHCPGVVPAHPPHPGTDHPQHQHGTHLTQPHHTPTQPRPVLMPTTPPGQLMSE